MVETTDSFDVLPEGLPNQIVPMLLKRLSGHLEDRLVNEVPESNPTRAILVKVGRFVENPLNKNVSVAIQSGDWEDPNYLDGRVDNSKFDNVQIRFLPVAEIGGGWHWWRRGTCRVQVYFVRQRYKEDLAMSYAFDFMGRLLKALEEAPIHGLQDDYGEIAIPPVYIEGSSFYESGGNNQFIWRGKILWRVLTERP